MAEEEEQQQHQTLEIINPSFPVGRVKKIIKFDKEITRISSEALFLISGAAEIFLHFLAEKSAVIAAEKKRKIVNLDHLRIAVKRHQPSREFLLDSLPQPSDLRPAADRTVKEKQKPKPKPPLPRNTRAIDSFFSKAQKEKAVDEPENAVADDAIVEAVDGPENVDEPENDDELENAMADDVTRKDVDEPENATADDVIVKAVDEPEKAAADDVIGKDVDEPGNVDEPENATTDDVNG